MEKENIVIEHDYTGLVHLDGEGFLSKKLEKAIVADLDREKRAPHTIDKQAADAFDQMVLLCDNVAKEFSGKLKAVVDFECHSATITLECFHIDFAVGEFMPVLKCMTTTALHVAFYPLTSGLLRMVLDMPYFSLDQ